MTDVESICMGGWEFFVSIPHPQFDEDKVGKWMYFSDDPVRCRELVSKAVTNGIVAEAKYAYPDGGVCCFYLHIDDVKGHKRVIEYFLENDMIKRTKAGKLHNISFKLDSQTDAGEYGVDYTAELKLEQLMDLATGEWKINTFGING